MYLYMIENKLNNIGFGIYAEKNSLLHRVVG